MSEFKMDSFRIPSFQSGINEYYSQGILKPYEAVSAYNCTSSEGSLKTFNEPTTKYTLSDNIHSLASYYSKTNELVLCGVGTKLKKVDGTDLYTISGEKLDFLNFEYNGDKVLVACSKSDVPFLYDGTTARKIKNRRKKYDLETGELSGYVDANGREHTTESTITTYAPKGNFIELHYDRLWIAGDSENPDRVYFSTSNVNGADIEDFTVPLSEEDEINQHGGFLDVRSYDGGKVIGMKVIFNSVVIFKNKSAYKIYGSSPTNYQLVEIFSCNGAIADKSIVAGNNGAYFLNSDGIYFFDGTNTNLVSKKIKNIIKRMNTSYADKAVGIYQDNKYYLSIPVDNSETNNLLIEFDVTNGSFMTYNVGNITYFLEYKNEVLYSSGKYVKSLFNGTTPMPLKWQTPFVDFGVKNARKMSEYIYFRARGNGSIKFTLTTERKSKELIVPLTDKEVLYKKKLKNKGRMFSLTIENVGTSSFELTAPEILCEIDND